MVINYIRHIRLKRAIELMKTIDLTISEIAYNIGLNSRNNFSKKTEKLIFYYFEEDL